MLRRPLLVAALLPLLAFGAQRSSGAPGPRDGLIAYAHAGGGDRFQIYTVTATGKHRRPLTRSRRFSSYDPAYSPSGRRIAFVRDFRQSDLWTMNADGTHRRPLTSTAAVDEIEPAWSPDGKELAFAVDRPSAQHGIWIVGADGRNRKQLTTGDDVRPSWSPDGAEIAFERLNQSPSTGAFTEIDIVPAAGGPTMTLTNDPGSNDLSPSWSPEGGKILFSSDRGVDPASAVQVDLWVMSADGSDVQQVTNTPSRDERDPAWSPDGRWIVYSGEGSFHGALSSQIYVSKANGTDRRILTHACGECAYLNEHPSWQPVR